jgi:hypothetical protein
VRRYIEGELVLAVVLFKHEESGDMRVQGSMSSTGNVEMKLMFNTLEGGVLQLAVGLKVSFKADWFDASLTLEAGATCSATQGVLIGGDFNLKLEMLRAKTGFIGSKRCFEDRTEYSLQARIDSLAIGPVHSPWVTIDNFRFDIKATKQGKDDGVLGDFDVEDFAWEFSFSGDLSTSHLSSDLSWMDPDMTSVRIFGATTADEGFENVQNSFGMVGGVALDIIPGGAAQVVSSADP